MGARGPVLMLSLLVPYAVFQSYTTDAKRSEQRHAPHYRVLPPGEFNCTMLQPVPVFTTLAGC